MLNNRDTCEQMLVQLQGLYAAFLDGGVVGATRWIPYERAQVIGKRIHRALPLVMRSPLGNADVRRMAEQNLEGCYQKRLLEAARFMWMDGVRLMIQGQWFAALGVLGQAAAKKDGWGWAVNHGDIWLAEASAKIVCALESKTEDFEWFEEAQQLVEVGKEGFMMPISLEPMDILGFAKFKMLSRHTVPSIKIRRM